MNTLRNFTNFYGVQLIIKIIHTGSIENITRYEFCAMSHIKCTLRISHWNSSFQV